MPHVGIARETQRRRIYDDPTIGLLHLAKDRIEQLYLASIPTALPDIRKGIGVKASWPLKTSPGLVVPALQIDPGATVLPSGA